MTYNEAINYIEQIGQKGSVLGLGPVTELLLRLGNPQDSLSIIHVAGTNGKGSICTFLEMLYREEERRVGRYISPTIHEYLERFQINGKMMQQEVFAELLTTVSAAVSGMCQDGLDAPTAFEIETAVAFLYFVKEKADIVILEVGMGGREDATNVIKHPLCTVFANIGMDHMQFLGDTIEKIAYEKAGIIKRGCPAVCYPGDARTIKVLKDEFHKVNSGGENISDKLEGMECEEEIGRRRGIEGEEKFGRRREIEGEEKIGYRKGIEDEKEPYVGREIDGRKECGFMVADINQLEILSETLYGSTFIYKGEEYHISLAGRYQIYNAITAIETKLSLDGHVIKEALSKASWEGRFNKICDNPIFIKDGAHNVQGAEALKESLNIHFTNAAFIFIIGVLRDKEYEKMMELLCPMAEACYLIKPQNARGLETEVLSEVVGGYCDDVMECEDVDEAVNLAVDRWREMTEASQKDSRELTGELRQDWRKSTGELQRDWRKSIGESQQNLRKNENVGSLQHGDMDGCKTENDRYRDKDVVIVAWGSLSYIGDVVLR